MTRLESDISADHQFYPPRNDIFACPACLEIFQKPHILEQHQTLKHAVSEHIDGDSGNNIIHNIFKIFKKGWIDTEKTPKIHRIKKVHNSTKYWGDSGSTESTSNQKRHETAASRGATRGASPTATRSLGFTAQRSSAIWGKAESPASATTSTVASTGSSEANCHRN